MPVVSSKQRGHAADEHPGVDDAADEQHANANNAQSRKEARGLSLESSDNLMTRLAKNEIYFKNYLPVGMILKGIDEVKEETVQRLARDTFDERFFCLTVLGPMNGNDLDKIRLDGKERKRVLTGSGCHILLEQPCERRVRR